MLKFGQFSKKVNCVDDEEICKKTRIISAITNVEVDIVHWSIYIYYIHYTYLQDKIYDMNIVTVVRVTLVSTSIYLQTMPHTERSRVVLLAESPAQETVGQARLAGPLPSQHHNLPPEHAVQPLLPPLLPFLPEQQLNQVLTPLPTHLELRRSCLVESVGTVQSVSPGLLGRARGGGSHHTGESEQE